MKIIYYNQKKDKLIKKAKKIAVFAAISVIGIWSFLWLPFFRVKKIEINDSLVNKKEVEEKLGLSLSSITQFFLPRNNFFLFPSKIAEEAILDSGLGVAEIEKKFPNKISIDFKEIKPKFLYCEESECFYIDKSGTPYETAPFFSDSPLPVLEFLETPKKILKLGEEFFSKDEANFLIDFGKDIKRLNLSIKKIVVEKDIKLTMNEEWQLIILLGEKDYKDIVEKLSLIFERKIKDRSNLKYIDMRFPNKAFYKLK